MTQTTSLFDLAAGLSQYDDIPNGRVNTLETLSNTYTLNSPVPSALQKDKSNVPSSTLSLLDETFDSIYATHRSHVSGGSSLRSQTINHQPTKLPREANKQLPEVASNCSPNRLLPIHAKQGFYTTMKVSVPPTAVPRLMPSPSTNQESSQPQLHRVVIEPDVEARNLLQELSEELDQIPISSLPDVRHLQGVLTEKYLHQRLNQLRPTPFVQLARKKTLQRIQQLAQKTLAQTMEENSLSMRLRRY